MKTVKVKVLKRHPYKGIKSVGQTYDCPAKLAHLLIAVGKVEPVDQGSAAKFLEPEKLKTESNVSDSNQSTEDFALENGVSLDDIKGTGRKGKVLKRDVQNYLTRDMKADNNESK